MAQDRDLAMLLVCFLQWSLDFSMILSPEIWVQKAALWYSAVTWRGELFYRPGNTEWFSKPTSPCRNVKIRTINFWCSSNYCTTLCDSSSADYYCCCVGRCSFGEFLCASSRRLKCVQQTRTECLWRPGVIPNVCSEFTEQEFLAGPRSDVLTSLGSWQGVDVFSRSSSLALQNEAKLSMCVFAMRRYCSLGSAIKEADILVIAEAWCYRVRTWNIICNKNQ